MCNQWRNELYYHWFLQPLAEWQPCSLGTCSHYIWCEITSLSTSPKDMLTKENELVDNSVENQWIFRPFKRTRSLFEVNFLFSDSNNNGTLEIVLIDFVFTLCYDQDTYIAFESLRLKRQRNPKQHFALEK